MYRKKFQFQTTRIVEGARQQGYLQLCCIVPCCQMLKCQKVARCLAAQAAARYQNRMFRRWTFPFSCRALYLCVRWRPHSTRRSHFLPLTLLLWVGILWPLSPAQRRCVRPSRGLLTLLPAPLSIRITASLHLPVSARYWLPGKTELAPLEWDRPFPLPALRQSGGLCLLGSLRVRVWRKL